jgi:hypothetical protein
MRKQMSKKDNITISRKEFDIKILCDVPPQWFEEDIRTGQYKIKPCGIYYTDQAICDFDKATKLCRHYRSFHKIAD